MRSAPWILAGVIAVLLLVTLTRGSGGGTSDGVGAGTAQVVRIVDGDTIVVRQGGHTDKVRYIGIDTPETVKPNTPVQCYGHAASRRNTRLLAGRAVRLVPGAESRDRYGRLLAYVYREPDGLFVNESLVREGYARTMTIAPNNRFAPRFAALSAHAQETGAGLWGSC